MKKYIYLAASLLTLSTVGLTSCQNEMEDMGNKVGKEVLFRVTANRGDTETRTTLTPDGAGNLACTWNKDDQLLVVNNSSGNKIGVITLVDGIDSPDGTFEGKVTLDGFDTVSLVYLGSVTDAESYASDTDNITLDVSAQDGSLASLTAKDVLTGEVIVENNSYVQKKGDVVQATATLRRQLAHGYFQLNFPDDIELVEGDEITITGEGLRSEGKINFKNGGNIANQDANYSGSTTITVTKAEDGNDFYITMLPVGNVTPTFTVTKDGVTYTAELGQHNWKSGEFVRKNNNGDGVNVEMEKVAAAVASDGKILGVKWARINDRSWVDCDWNHDDAFFFSYIPEVPLINQGIKINYTGNNIENGTVNPYVYHYQWGRNFGFAASNQYYLYDIKLPNWRNFPLSWAEDDLYYNATNSLLSSAQSPMNPGLFVETNNNDWCTTDLTSWPEHVDDEGGVMSVAPEGFRLPTKTDFEKLLPNGINESFKATKSFKVDGETIRPVFAKTTIEGTTVVWAILNSSTNYLAIYEFAGSYTLDQLTKTMFENDVIDYIDFPAHGARESFAGIVDWQSGGWYWSNTTEADGKAYVFRFSISNTNTVYLQVFALTRKCALSVRCIYED